MKPLSEIFAQVKDESIGLVQDGEIFYLVMNTEQNLFDFDQIQRMHQCLDQIEKSTGPACLVTIGTKRFFSTGFDLEKWAINMSDAYTMILMMQQVFNRFLTLEIPTMSVYNGSAIAGGLLLSLTHDFRIMNENRTYVCLSEINLGITINAGFASIVKNSLTPQAAKLLTYGGRFNAQQCLKMGVIDNVYKDEKELMNQIQEFAKVYAPKGEARSSLKDLKTNLHKQTSRDLLQEGLSIGVVNKASSRQKL
ncbi:enoyl-hydratase [Stylonychia lemnae]|uniref:Enoyl-hydratase n=1 Tax=Stylonychia lemnae TaxID=5949 RepID=A0A078AV78_STYLE|nr:enoyl-hydratase [Stylonychia lemnae]|eukprot:CDW85901.1 enoyl-hydratase [Stylonychia lemnae]